MNDFELALPDKDRFDQMLAELKPAIPVLWHFGSCKWEETSNEFEINRYNNGLEDFKSALRDIYDFGTTLVRGTPKFCYALYRVYNGLYFVKDNDSRYHCSNSLSIDKENNFLKFARYFGISDTSAYAYRDLGLLVDPESLDFYFVFKGYSLSLLIEMIAYCRSCSNSSDNVYVYDCKKLTQVVSKDTTIQAMRYYRKIMTLWRKRKEPFQYDDVRCEIDENTKVADVIYYYEKLIQEQEQNKLNALTAQVESKDKPNADELVGNDVLIKQLREQIADLKAISVPNLGKCDGCTFNGKNLNKCRCCRRYKDLKDLFQSE